MSLRKKEIRTGPQSPQTAHWVGRHDFRKVVIRSNIQSQMKNILASNRDIEPSIS